jgi:hypothetical protein
MDNIAPDSSDLLYTNPFGERFLTHVNHSAFYKLSSHAVYDEKFAHNLLKPNTLNFIIGSDSGLLVRYLLNQTLPKGSSYIVIEPDSILSQLQHANLLPQDLPDNISCISMASWQETIEKHNIQDYLYINGIHTFNALCAEEDNIGEYAELSWHVSELLSQLHWQANMSLGNETFITQQLNNLADNIIPAQVLKQHFKGQTVAILAGGPSLDDFLPWIQQHQDDLVIFAVSRIAQQLLNIGLMPDFVFSVDPTELSFDISKDMLKFDPSVTLVHSYHIYPALLNQWPGQSLYLKNRVPWDSPLNEPNLSSAGPTVTNTAISVAHQLGFSRVLLFGVDLCFTKEGFTHAKGSNERKAGPRFTLTSLSVETNDGRLAPTTCDFDSAIRTLENQAAHLKSTGCQLINPSPAAAKIQSVEFIPIDNLKLQKNQKLLPNSLPVIDIDALYNRMEDDLKRASHQLKSIANLADKAQKINDKMYDDLGAIQNYKDKKTLDQIEKTLKRKYRSFSKLVKNFGIRYFLKTLRPFDDDWTAEEAKQIGHDYYEAYLFGSKRLLSLIENSLQRIKSRRQEHSPTPDFDLLFQQWEKDQSFGRAKLWHKHHKHITIPEKYQKKLQAFSEKFQQLLASKDTKHFRQAKDHADFRHLHKRAQTLFKHAKKESLQDLIKAVSKHPDRDQAETYRHLIEAYLNELNQDQQNALQYYHRIIDGDNPSLYQDALSRIAAISINIEDYANAELALQCLSQLSALHLPLYAESLRINGKFLEAIDCYNEYISQYPNDALTQLKLALLYKEINNIEAAKMMLELILQYHPDNMTARELLSDLGKR